MGPSTQTAALVPRPSAGHPDSVAGFLAPPAGFLARAPECLYAAAMCRSIRQLRRGEDAGAATTGEAQAAALQYVRKISGFRAPSARNEEAFRVAIEEIAAATERLLLAIGTPVAPGPDPFADPALRRAILAARPASARPASARPAAARARPSAGEGRA